MSIQTPPTLLREKVRDYDPVLMLVRSTGPQEYEGLVEKVYSRRFEGMPAYDSTPLRFVGSSGTFGDVTLRDGERALVFVRFLAHSRRYYQAHWRGHFSVISREGSTFAVANWDSVSNGSDRWGPEYLRSAAFLLSEQEPWKVALPYDFLEKHLREELDLPTNGTSA